MIKRYFVFFYRYMIDDVEKKRDGHGSIWLKELDVFPSNQRVCELICETATSEPDIRPKHVVITGWEEMGRADFNNFCTMETIHRTAVDHINDGTCETYCGQTFSAFDDNYQSSNTDYNCPQCIAEVNKDRVKKIIRDADTDFERLKSLCKELLEGADKCSKDPHFIVQPFMGIVKRHSRLINRHKLWENKDD